MGYNNLKYGYVKCGCLMSYTLVDEFRKDVFSWAYKKPYTYPTKITRKINETLSYLKTNPTFTFHIEYSTFPWYKRIFKRKKSVEFYIEYRSSTQFNLDKNKLIADLKSFYYDKNETKLEKILRNFINTFILIYNDRKVNKTKFMRY